MSKSRSLEYSLKIQKYLLFYYFIRFITKTKNPNQIKFVIQTYGLLTAKPTEKKSAWNLNFSIILLIEQLMIKAIKKSCKRR